MVITVVNVVIMVVGGAGTEAGTIVDKDKAKVEGFRWAIKDGLSVNRSLEVSGAVNQRV